MSATAPPRAAPFSEEPCLCCKGHVPIPLQIERHHIHPQYSQIFLWGRVRNRETVALCRSSHRNLHIYLTALMAGQPLPHVNAYTARYAREGLRLIMAAHEAAGVPIAPGGGGE